MKSPAFLISPFIQDRAWTEIQVEYEEEGLAQQWDWETHTHTVPALERALGFISPEQWNLFQVFVFFLFPHAPQMILSLWRDSTFCFIPISSNTSGFWTAKSSEKADSGGRNNTDFLVPALMWRWIDIWKNLVSWYHLLPEAAAIQSTPAQFVLRNSGLYVPKKWNKLVCISCCRDRMGWSLLDFWCPTVLWQFKDHLYWLRCENPPPKKVTWIEGQDFMG